MSTLPKRPSTAINHEYCFEARASDGKLLTGGVKVYRTSWFTNFADLVDLAYAWGNEPIANIRVLTRSRGTRAVESPTLTRVIIVALNS